MHYDASSSNPLGLVSILAAAEIEMEQVVQVKSRTTVCRSVVHKVIWEIAD